MSGFVASGPCLLRAFEGGRESHANDTSIPVPLSIVGGVNFAGETNETIYNAAYDESLTTSPASVGPGSQPSSVAAKPLPDHFSIM